MAATAELVNTTVPGGANDDVVEIKDMAGSIYRMSGLPVEAGKFVFSIWICAENAVNITFTMLGKQLTPISVTGGFLWERFVFAEEITAAQNTGYIDCMPSTNGTIRLYMAKLEKGNLVTDWSPAPEDIEQRMSSAESKITDDAILNTVLFSQDYMTTINGLRDSIPSDYQETKDALVALREEYSTTMTQTKDKLEVAVNTTKTLNDFVSGLDGALKKISESYTKYFTFTSDGMYIGDTESPIYLKLDSDKMSFYTRGGGEVAYMSDEKLYITNAEFLAHMRIGKYEFDIDDNGDLVLYYVP